MNGRPLKIIDGSANTPLSKKVFKLLKNDFNQNTDYVECVSNFSDGETQIFIDDNMRGCDVFVIQPTSPPSNEHLMQLYLILDALKRSDCWRITAVIPYYGYGRQDKKLKPRVPISARAVANLIELGGINRVLTIDLHSNQIQGYFDCPVDHLFASMIFKNHIKDFINIDNNSIIVSPDEGGIARAIYYSKNLGTNIAMIHKSRSKPNEIDEMVLLGSVCDKNAIIIDDMVDTAGTLCKASKLLKKAGAKKVFGYATHGVLSGPAYENIENSDFDNIFISDTIKQNDSKLILTNKIKIISCSNLLANAISNIHNESSVSNLFDGY